MNRLVWKNQYTVLVCQGCYNRGTKDWVVKTIEVYVLTVWGPEIDIKVSEGLDSVHASHFGS